MYSWKANESFNSLILEYAPKGIGFTQSTYESKIACAVLHNNEGKEFRERIFRILMNALEKSFRQALLLRDLDVEINGTLYHQSLMEKVLQRRKSHGVAEPVRFY